MIKLFSVAIFAGLFFASHQQSDVEGCWTEWFDRDDPSSSGDWETLSNLREENPGRICATPVAIEAQTLTGISASATGDVIFESDTTAGFACRNEDQNNKKTCNDYRVRFSCPPAACHGKVCWTKWYDRDDPSATGDWELLSDLRKENPGKICPTPVAIDVKTLTGISPAAAGDVIFESGSTVGFVCRNEDQNNKRMCNDYRIRFSCPPAFCEERVCWTHWYDRDDPSGTGDFELLSDLRKENPGQICETPVSIVVVTTDNTPATSTGDIINTSSPTEGFVCRMQDQPSGGCRDYKVRFGCPC